MLIVFRSNTMTMGNSDMEDIALFAKEIPTKKTLKIFRSITMLIVFRSNIMRMGNSDMEDIVLFAKEIPAKRNTEDI